eukprot:GHRR01015397.1.p2 GENE.GHRR01015397.1~~GHRR01015397.1.p2  ORF type:complete len:128 (+),score=43.12 GHRR01015397.1:864-1247(+)
MSSQPSSAAGGLHDFNKRVMRKQHWTTSRRQLEHNLFVEQSMMQRQKAPDLLSEQQRLVQRLSRLNLLVLEACADGNCLFRSVSQQLYGSQVHYAVVRHHAVEYIRAYPHEYQAFLGENLTTHPESH